VSISDTLAGITEVSALAVDWAAASPRLFAGTDRGVWTALLSAPESTWAVVPGSDGRRVHALRVDRAGGPAPADRSSDR